MTEDEWNNLRQRAIDKLTGGKQLVDNPDRQVIRIMVNKGADYILTRLKQREAMLYALAAARPHVTREMDETNDGHAADQAKRTLDKIDNALAGIGEHPAIAALRACLLFVEAEFEQRGRENDPNYPHKAEPLLRMIEAVLDDQI